MRVETVDTFWARIYLSGPIVITKQELRAECMREGLCVNIHRNDYIYTGGEESGYVVELINYPRFPKTNDQIHERAVIIAQKLMASTHQHSAMIVTPDKTVWCSTRQENL